jgi:hypothetical protein
MGVGLCVSSEWAVKAFYANPWIFLFSTLQFLLQILLPFFTIMEPFMRIGQGEFLQQWIIFCIKQFDNAPKS